MRESLINSANVSSGLNFARFSVTDTSSSHQVLVVHTYMDRQGYEDEQAPLELRPPRILLRKDSVYKLSDVDLSNLLARIHNLQ